MFKISNVWRVLVVCIILLHAQAAYAKEYKLEADVDARAVYDDNIFLTNQLHDSTKGIIVTPALSGVITEENWESELRARLRINKYSDKSLNSNDQFFDLTGRYTAERNIFSLNVKYNLESNISSTSTDFGIVGRRVNRKTQSIAPQYTRLLTERSSLMLSYTYTDVDFLEADNTGFTHYITETGSGSLLYNLTERDELTISLTAVDYTSKNELVTYQLFVSRFGVDHKFSETLSMDFLAGVSRRNSTNLQTQSFDFFEQPITVTQEIDAKNRGLVFDIGVTQQLESGKIEGRIIRDNKTDSFGGLNEVNRFTVNYTDKMSELWRYRINGRLEDITAIST
ncbi:MAG: hypothetical protein KAU21_08060, partial [Gammaproteobacteria bacterium]|nr:hypothetical protein [Gammaproteobacteria bacterium]